MTKKRKKKGEEQIDKCFVPGNPDESAQEQVKADDSPVKNIEAKLDEDTEEGRLAMLNKLLKCLKS
jgi:hypothetical protein